MPPTFEDALSHLIAAYSGTDPEEIMSALEIALMSFKEQHPDQDAE
jgi:hypothetical protein